MSSWELLLELSLELLLLVLEALLSLVLLLGRSWWKGRTEKRLDVFSSNFR